MVLAFGFLLRKGLFVVHCFISRLPARELLGISQTPIRVHTSDAVAFFCVAFEDFNSGPHT